MNVRTYLSAVCVASLLFLLTSCHEDEKPSNPDHISSVEQASEKASGMTEGEVVSSQHNEAGDQSTWGVTIENDLGSHIIFVFNDDGELHHAESSGEGSFDYEVTPGGDLINFSEAKGTAYDQMTDISDHLNGWDLRKNDAGIYVYKFFFQVGENQQIVKINALTGEVIE